MDMIDCIKGINNVHHPDDNRSSISTPLVFIRVLVGRPLIISFLILGS